MVLITLALSGPNQNCLPQCRRLCLGGGGEVLLEGAHARPAVHRGEEEDRRPVRLHHAEGGAILRAEAGAQFNRNKFGLKFGLKTD